MFNNSVSVEYGSDSKVQVESDFVCDDPEFADIRADVDAYVADVMSGRIGSRRASHGSRRRVSTGRAGRRIGR